MRREPIRCFEGNAKPHEAFWRVRNAAETENGEAEVELYGVISEYSWFDDDVTPKMFKDDLARIGAGGPVTIRINSGGGDVIAASVMRTIIKDYPGQITVKIDGIAASAAVVVALAGDRILIQDTAYMMIHDPGFSVFWAWLDIATLEGMVDTLKSVKGGILDTYAAKTGIGAERIGRMMADETWMSANEAVKLGFADEVVGGERAAQNNQAMQNALKNYMHVPAGLLNMKQPEPVETIDPEVQRLRDEAKLLR